MTMALNGTFVIDGVTHGFDARLELGRGRPDYRYGEMIFESTWAFQDSALPDPYRLTREEFFQEMSADALASAVFLESATDVAFYHTIPAWGIWPDLSPIGVGLEIKERYPGRMFVYGAASLLEGKKALDDLRRQHEEWGVTAVKLYPLDFINGRIQPWEMSDRDVLYPLLELCGELDIRTVAIHKSVPIGTAPTRYFRPDDADYPAADFPDLNFEIVHGGFTFLEETAFQLERFANIWVNLEVTSALVLRHPKIFARILGELILWGGHEKITWGSGASAFHPQPLLEGFANFEMPEDFVEEYGYPELTSEMKADILGRNAARMHGLDIDRLAGDIKDDELARRREENDHEAWGALPQRSAAVAQEPAS
jgi:uncharacterized protein